MDTLGEALPQEMARVTKLITIYAQFPAGAFAIAMMQRDLDLAARAMAEGDITGMMSAYESLKEYEA